MAQVGARAVVQSVLQNLESIMANKELHHSQLIAELHKLCDTLKFIFSLLEGAEKRLDLDFAVKAWFHQLMDVVYDVEDFLDEIFFKVDIRGNNQGDLQRKVTSAFSCLNLKKFYAFSGKVNVFCSVLDHLAQGARIFSLNASVDLTRESKATSSFHLGHEILGRDEEKGEIVSLICGPIVEVEELSFVSISGIGGLGKTTLAKLIFQDSRIKNNFDVMLWVDVPKRCNKKSLLKQMIKSAPSLQYIDMDEIDEMVESLHKMLTGRRYFLVLDGCWNVDEIRALRGVIDCGNRGSTVLVTSRLGNLASSLGSTHVHMLDPLSDDTSFQIFTNLAFSSIDKQTHPELVEVAKQIVMQCGGLPLFLIILGGMLRDETDVGEWGRVLEKLRRVNHMEPTHGVFELFYEKLPSYLRLPFCSLPLKYHCGTNVDELVCIWMALGFLNSDENAQQPEYVGRKYLGELAKLCLLDDVKYAAGGAVSEFSMHDLVYELARLKAKDQLVVIENETSKKTVGGFMSIILDVDDSWVSKVDGIFNEAGKARVLMLHTQFGRSTMLLKTIVHHCKLLRVLGLGGCDIETLPDSIGHLKHLRYLDVGRNPRLKRLPDSVCDLLLLQTLFLHGCEQLEEVPTCIGRLRFLRYLTLTTQQESLPDGIGDLMSLRTMGLDRCPRLACLPRGIKNLKNLQTLGLVDCEELNLVDDSSADGLSGVDGIETLLLVGLPKFVGLASLGIGATSLKQLHIQNCPQLTETTWIKEFISLQSLTIEDCPALLAVGDLSADLENLEELIIRYCESMTDIAWINQMVSLCSLVIEDCPNMTATDNDIREIATMQQLEIRLCPLLTDVAWVGQFVSLHSLVLEECPNLLTIGKGISKITTMERLDIKQCPKLVESCSSPSGDDWHHIQHIPHVHLE